MRKSKIFITASVIAAMLVPFSVFAATSNTPAAKNIRGFLGLDASKLTDTQKADVKTYTQKMADLQKEFINKMVDNGALTKEQGEAETKKIDESLSKGDTSSILPGYGKNKGGHGGRGDFGFGKIDTSKLTDTQKTDLISTYKKIAELQKSVIKKMVSDSLMTKEQGDAASNKVDETLKDIEENGMSKGLGLMGCFKFFGVKGIDTSKLTGQQKTDLTNFSTKMTELQKELINKMVTYGLITKDQGDNAIKGIGSKKTFDQENRFKNGRDMNKGHSGGKGGMNKSPLNNNSSGSSTKSAS